MGFLTKRAAHRRVILEERMVELEALYLASGEEAALAHVKVEVLQGAVSVIFGDFFIQLL